MIDLFHGTALHAPTVDDVQRLLDDVRAEPLHWEAKGVAINAGEVRKQVCGFANSHDGGYLILGTHVEDDEWKLPGVEFPNNDPPAWISEVADGVQPRPEGLDTQPIRVAGNKWIAVVWVPPTPTPPCNAHGTIYERVSGRTVSVREPLRLAQLITRGETAHEQAKSQARVAADRALAFGQGVWQLSDEHVTFALGLCAVGYEDGLVTRLFSEATIEQLTSVPGQPLIDHRQDAVMAHSYQAPRVLGEAEWLVHAAWDGSVGVASRWHDMTQVTDSAGWVEGPIGDTWQLAATTLASLGPRGPAYLSLLLDERFAPQIPDPDLGDNVSGSRPRRIERGPIDAAVNHGVLSGIEREIRRLLGFQRAIEPDDR